MKTRRECNLKMQKMGWDMEVAGDMVSGVVDNYRGSQGGFKTLWRPTPEQCLKDVETICNARKDPANQRVPF